VGEQISDLTNLLPGLRLPSGEVTPGSRSERTLRLNNAKVACSFRLEGKRVLDVGCAEGLHALYMSESAEEVVGVDHRRSKISMARNTADALGIQNVTFRCGDVRDQTLLRDLGRFDLVLAWGFLHRVSDIFSLLYTLKDLSDAWSFEWRTPVLPFMSSLSIAYHAPVGPALDPMNISSPVTQGLKGESGSQVKKIEGETGFWEPTPGAIVAIARRLGYAHWRLLGYSTSFVPESTIIERSWKRHLKALRDGTCDMHELPRTRVHMILEKVRNSVLRDDLSGHVKLPEWDLAIRSRDSFQKADVERDDQILA
jgi:SAM-dependent methyltransferase